MAFENSARVSCMLRQLIWNHCNFLFRRRLAEANECLAINSDVFEVFVACSVCFFFADGYPSRPCTCIISSMIMKQYLSSVLLNSQSKTGVQKLEESAHLKGHCHQYLDNFERQRDIFLSAEIQKYWLNFVLNYSTSSLRL